MDCFICRAARFAASTLIVLLAAGALARAEPVFSFAATPGKLPKTVVPTHYAIDLKPDLEKLSLAGPEVVDIEVLEPTDRLMLNAVNITIDAATLDGDGAQATAAFDATAETVTLTFP